MEPTVKEILASYNAAAPLQPTRTRSPRRGTPTRASRSWNCKMFFRARGKRWAAPRRWKSRDNT